MSSNKDIVMSPISRRDKCTRQLSIDPQKDYSTPLIVETSVEYDLPTHIYPPKGATPILMLHPAYEQPSRNIQLNSPIPLQSFNERKYDSYATSIDLRTKVNITKKDICGKLKSECDRCCSNSSKKIIRTTKLNASINNKLPLGDSFTNNLIDGVAATFNKVPQKSTIYGAIENHLLLSEEAGFKVRMQQQQSQLNIQTQNNFSNEHLWNPTVSQTDSFTSMVKQTCQFGCCNTVVPSRSEFLAPGLPPSLIRTPVRSTAAGSPKVRARSRRTNAINSVPDYFSAGRPLRSSIGPNMPTSLNHQRSRSNIALYSSAKPHQISSTVTPKTLINQIPKSLSQTMTSTTVGPCRDSGCSIGTDSSSNSVNSTKLFNQQFDRISVGVDSGFNTPGDSPFDVHMESNDANNNSVFYQRNIPLANKYSNLINPYAHIINLQHSLTPSVVPRYQVNNPILQPYYLHEPLLNLAY